MTAITTRDLAPTTNVRAGGWTLVAAGFTGAAAGVFLAFVPPAVGPDRYSFPLTPAGYTAIQAFFFVHQVALAFGLFTVWRSGRAGSGRFAALGGILAVASMSLLAAAELIAILGADTALGSELAGVIGGIYGAVSLLNGVSLMIFGIAALTAGVWTGWRRVTLLVLGIYVIVPLTPAIFGPFVLARLTIAGWMLLFAALGWALLSPGPRAAESR